MVWGGGKGREKERARQGKSAGVFQLCFRWGGDAHPVSHPAQSGSNILVCKSM
jgi:hypothetical protein